jgi:outer membrane protein OmpA-like peptidoglycan-associated protein
MAELRSLLLGPAEAQIAEVHARLTDPQRQLAEVTRVLPAAVAVRSRQDGELTDALAPIVATSLDRAVRKNPQALSDAIFPVMGPAIRKAISVALAGMVQSLNQSLTHSLSPQGLKWRVEALRTGKSFAEVVLIKTLRYRVEQVFLIHKETGLLLGHVSAGGAAVQDADMVSGMLTAIQDFVRDSFSTGRGDQLETLQVGELTVWVEQGPLAILAGVIRGSAPQELRPVFQATLERIHFQFGDALKDFSGDAEPFAAAGPLLEDCLAAQYGRPERADSPPRRVTPLAVITALVVAALLLWGFFWLRERRRWDSYLAALKAEPGVVVTDAGVSGGRRFVTGLRDPLARDPQELMREARVDAAKVVSRWQPYQALTPEFVLARAKSLLEPPPTVSLKLEDGALAAEGFATHQWVTETRRAARLIPGLGRLNEERLLDLDRIEKPLLMFELDTTTLAPGQEEKLSQLVADITRLQALAEALDKNVRLEITGHTDGSGAEARNAALSRGRAEHVAAELESRLPAKSKLTISPAGTKEKLREEVSEEDRAANRSVTFRIVFADAR